MESSGTYSTVIDVSEASIGDTLSGWLEVFDPAGHPLEDSGTEESPLFIISFGPDGSPVIQTTGLIGPIQIIGCIQDKITLCKFQFLIQMATAILRQFHWICLLKPMKTLSLNGTRILVVCHQILQS